MSEEMQKDPLQEELDASLAKEAELEKENAALGAELGKKKEGLLDRLNAEAKENVERLNKAAESLTQREVAIMADFTSLVRELNDSVSDLQAYFELNKEAK